MLFNLFCNKILHLTILQIKNTYKQVDLTLNHKRNKPLIQTITWLDFYNIRKQLIKLTFYKNNLKTIHYTKQECFIVARNLQRHAEVLYGKVLLVSNY